MEMNRTQFVALAALLVAAFVWPAKGMAADSDFYAGKTITVYVGRPPGSGADLAVRSFVRYWAQHVPGEPTMIVKNVPGGGGSRVWNLAWDNKRPKDVEIYFSPVSATSVIVQQRGLRADLSQLPLVGSLRASAESRGLAQRKGTPVWGPGANAPIQHPGPTDARYPGGRLSQCQWILRCE
jgi:tripartite-type tricarboxylate transporter receptor subunit TctC